NGFLNRVHKFDSCRGHLPQGLFGRGLTAHRLVPTPASIEPPSTSRLPRQPAVQKIEEPHDGPCTVQDLRVNRGLGNRASPHAIVSLTGGDEHGTTRWGAKPIPAPARPTTS